MDREGSGQGEGTGGAPPRVLICATGFPRSAEDPHKPFLLAHARSLAEAGARVTVLCPGAPGLAGREWIEGVEVVRFRYAPRRFETLAYDGAMYRRVVGPHALLVPAFVACFVASAVLVAHRRRVDVVHGHWWAPTGMVAVAAASLAGAASVVHLHGSDVAIAQGPLRWVARSVLARAGAVLAVSEELAAWAGEVSGRQVDVVPMPLPLAAPHEPVAPPAGGPVLGVGRLVHEKGFDVLVRAAGLTGQRVLLAGEGPQRAELEALAAEVGARLELLGEVAPAEVAELYRRSSLVAVPSRREGFGMVAAEAAAHGRAVVGSAVGALPWIVEDGVTGLLVAPGDHRALAEALTRADPRMGAGGPARVAALAPAAHAQALLGAYRDASRSSSWSRPAGSSSTKASA